MCLSLPVKDSRPHHSSTGIHGHVNVQCLMHPHDVTKPKVHGHKWCNNRREGRVRQAHHQNEQMVGKLEKRRQQFKTKPICYVCGLRIADCGQRITTYGSQSRKVDCGQWTVDYEPRIAYRGLRIEDCVSPIKDRVSRIVHRKLKVLLRGFWITDRP